MFTSAVMCLALNIYWEARDQPLAGQIAVAQVVINRTNDTRYPDTPCDVIYEAEYSNEESEHPTKHMCQFSWFCDGISDEVQNKTDFEWSLRVAKAVLDGKTPDLTEMATHYHSIDVKPTWSYYYKKTIRIEDHIFYKRGR
jgi:spore germination cell wall hydrolase CwlJ-like protein